MHDELCRKCGGTLTNWSLCSECRKPIKRICVQCGLHTDEVIHSLCFYHIDTLQTETALSVTYVNVEDREKPIITVKNREIDQILGEIM